MDEIIGENLLDTGEIGGFYIKINPELKKQFNIKCLENNTNMSVEVKKFMEEYIKEN
jgi:hypothetical protein